MSKKLFALLLLLCFSVCVWPSSCIAAYRITETELTALENNLNNLWIINQQSQQELETLANKLKASQTALSEAQNESEKLETQLITLRVASEQQEKLLQTANESLDAYAKEVKKKTAQIKRQRAIAYVLLAGVVAVAVSK